ncbi:MAG: hypothetical protein IKF90_21670 [Parasporobacterium sp.]|nr:hypothetical protein [Parasporobacterium sp.]
MVDLGLQITRGDATMLYATSHGSYTVRIHLRLDERIDGQKLRIALDKTAQRYPYFCVSLKRNEREFYYEINSRPIALLHTNRAIELSAPETNGHIWAVCYDEEDLFIDFFHGRSDGTGIYELIATLMYYYYDEQDIPGVKTMDMPVTDQEIHDPVDDLPLLDLSKVNFPASPKALNLMEASCLEHVNGKGLIIKLMIPEKSFLPFIRSNDGTPGIMLSVLIARAIERIHPRHEAPLVSNYIVNSRPMLKANETFHNCTNRVVFHYDDKIRKMPLERQCTIYRGKTFVQADEDMIVRGMTLAGSMAQMILDLPDFSSKAKIAAQAMVGTYDAVTYIVSYVGRWSYPQLGHHIREFWTETPVGPFPLIEVAAVNGKIFVSFLQPFLDRRYYDALIDELQENGIEYVECGTTHVCTADIKA